MSTHTPSRRRSSAEPVRVLPVREQALVVNRLLQTRLDRLLPRILGETGFDMWLVVCHEDNHDPVFNTLIPVDTWAPILQILVFCRRPDGTVERLNLSRTNLQGLYENRWAPKGPEDQWACLRRLVDERQPRRIAINQSEVIWAADGLTATLKDRLLAALGPEYASRVSSGQEICVRWGATMVAEELPVYEQVVALAHQIIATAFSRAAITPGVTTVQDLRWFYWQRLADCGLSCSFTPFFDIQRSPQVCRSHDPADGAMTRRLQNRAHGAAVEAFGRPTHGLGLPPEIASSP